MGVVVALLAVVSICLLLVVACIKFRKNCQPNNSRCRWSQSIAKFFSRDSEEKAFLTGLKGHFNANGYLVSSDSDIRLDWTGSFRRFESVDSEGALGVVESAQIPPQPLRPAPTPNFQSRNSESFYNQGLKIDDESSAGEEIHGRAASTVGSSGSTPVAASPAPLARAASSESVSSQSSVAVADLVEPNVAGYICVGIDYDGEGGDLVVSVIEAKDLYVKEVSTNESGLLDTFVTVYLLPTRTTDMQTRVYRSSHNPSYKEKFLFGLEVTDLCRSSVMFHVYLAGREENTLLGSAQLHLADLPHTRQPVTTWLTLLGSDLKESSLGEILFSLSYLPTAERLTVVIVKARNLKFSGNTGDPYVKVYLLKNGKKVHKKKTQTKRGEACPIFNEAMIFNVPNTLLQSVELRITVDDGENGGRTIGHVIVGCQATGKALSHWSQILVSLRKPVAMWHNLLRPQL